MYNLLVEQSDYMYIDNWAGPTAETLKKEDPHSHQVWLDKGPFLLKGHWICAYYDRPTFCSFSPCTNGDVCISAKIFVERDEQNHIPKVIPSLKWIWILDAPQYFKTFYIQYDFI